MKKDLEEFNLPYGERNIKVKMTAVGYVDSDFSNTITYVSAPRITIVNEIINVYNLRDNVSSIEVYANGINIGTFPYDSTSATIPVEISLSQFSFEDGPYSISVKAIGDGVNDNLSNLVGYYHGGTPIYGVSGEGGSSPTLIRTDSSIGLNYTLNSDGTIDSDFDNCKPWSDITEVIDDNGNVFVRIPKHYTKYTLDESGLKTTQITSIKPDETWVLNPIFTDGQGKELDYVDIGKYIASGTSSLAKSVSGKSPLVNISITNLRTACKANGSGYQQFDIWAWKMLQDLFMVEFATTDSQSIMYGYANGNSVAISSGTTDSVSSLSGSPVSNTDGKHAMKYRGIENLWGNVYQWLDGIIINSFKPYVCENPNNYTSSSLTNYKSVAYNAPSTNSSSRIKKLGYDSLNPFIQIPTDLGGTNSTYYCDYGYYSNSTYRACRVGGFWSSGLNAGAWYFVADSSASAADSVRGGRLVYRPL